MTRSKTALGMRSVLYRRLCSLSGWSNTGRSTTSGSCSNQRMIVRLERPVRAAICGTVSIDFSCVSVPRPQAAQAHSAELRRDGTLAWVDQSPVGAPLCVHELQKVKPFKPLHPLYFGCVRLVLPLVILVPVNQGYAGQLIHILQDHGDGLSRCKAAPPLINRVMIVSPGADLMIGESGGQSLSGLSHVTYFVGMWVNQCVNDIGHGHKTIFYMPRVAENAAKQGQSGTFSFSEIVHVRLKNTLRASLAALRRDSRGRGVIHIP